MMFGFIGFLPVLAIFSRNLIYCEASCDESSTKSDGFNVIWHKSDPGQSATSTPLCLNSNYTLIKRNCLRNGSWDDANNVNCSLYNFNTKCRKSIELTKKCLYIDERGKNFFGDCLLDLPENKKDCLKICKDTSKFNLKLPAERMNGADLFQNTSLEENYGIDNIKKLKLLHVINHLKDANKNSLKIQFEGNRTGLIATGCYRLTETFGNCDQVPMNVMDKVNVYYTSEKVIHEKDTLMKYIKFFLNKFFFLIL